MECQIITPESDGNQVRISNFHCNEHLRLLALRVLRTLCVRTWASVRGKPPHIIEI